MSFIVKDKSPAGHEVSLHQDDEDVDIYIDDEMVMTITKDGYLIRHGCSHLLGLHLDDHDCIKDVDEEE